MKIDIIPAQPGYLMIFWNEADGPFLDKSDVVAWRIETEWEVEASGKNAIESRCIPISPIGCARTFEAVGVVEPGGTVTTFKDALTFASLEDYRYYLSENDDR